MASFVIEGGRRMHGELIPQGAKNEALQILCATLLTPEAVEVYNLPDILDVNNLIQLLRDLGVETTKIGEGAYRFKAENIDLNYLQTPQFLKQSASLRGSVMIVGPLVARFGKAVIAKPGGDKIGRRRLDTHFLGIQKLGAEFSYNPQKQIYEISAKELIGTYMLLDEASVTGTANILMAAVLAKGKTTIYNAACEPYLQQLSKMLNAMGAHISGIGSNLLEIEGVESLGGCKHTILPDMIEIGSFIGMAAMTGSDIRLKNVSVKDLGIIPDSFRRLGIRVEQEGDDLYIPQQDSYEIETFIRAIRSAITAENKKYLMANIPKKSLPKVKDFLPGLTSPTVVTLLDNDEEVAIHVVINKNEVYSSVDKLKKLGATGILILSTDQVIP